MTWFEREFIAVPEDRKGQLVYKWPDVNIRRFSRVVVNADEVALFVRSGEVIAMLPPGRHRIDAEELPMFGALADLLSGGNSYRAELYFVASREISGLKFGGRLSDIRDPSSELIVTLRAHGEFALSVRDPAELITRIAGTADLPDHERIHSWCAELLLKGMKEVVSRGISERRWPVVGLGGYTSDIEAAMLQRINPSLYEYGLRIPKMGNFDIATAPEDTDHIKRLAKDRLYSKMTGGWENYANVELPLSAAQGLARGSTTADGMLGMAMGMAALQGHPATPWAKPAAPGEDQPTLEPPANPAALPPSPTPDPNPATLTCQTCDAVNPAHARFCMNCADPLR